MRLYQLPTLVLLPSLLLSADVPLERMIPNELSETWPLEHVYFEFPAAAVKEPLTCTIQGVTRPTQADRVTVDGRDVVRLWTVATIGWKDEQGNEIKNPRANPESIRKVKAAFRPGTAPSALTLREEGDCYLIDNGVYEFKVRRYAGDFKAPTPLEQLPHWIGGMRVKGQPKWDGRTTLQGPALMKGARTEIVARGPVQIDIRITLYAEQPVGATNETVEAVPLTVGKQSFRFAPNDIPRETVAKRENHYEALVRFVAEDPWIDVAERYYFARDPAIQPWGFCQEYVVLGGKDGMPIDTAMWVRWFEWDKFGGNVDLLFAPAKMRPEQKGRPFAMLRPIWNQGPGGSQDFFLTSGGKTPPWNDSKKTTDDPAGTYPPEAPAIGVYAAYPSKWVGPFAQTIVCRAENGDSGNWRLPLVPADNAAALYYGQRAFGICVGPRKLFDDTGRCNGMVRRHTDWTLVALINKYVLDWPRDPAKAGPNLAITQARVAQLRSDLKAGKNSSEVKMLREAWDALQKKESELADLQKQGKAAEEQVKAQRKETEGEDNDILRLIVSGAGRQVNLPSSDLWRQRRYQDDFLNPTSSSVRGISGIRRADLFAGGKPVGGADQAALAYIICDPDSWMGWRNGWMPGNPNFHTDKYLSALYLGGAMLDHPHAREWIEYAHRNFEADARGVLLPPDGVGVECPGYAGYAMNLLLPLAAAFQNLGFGNLPAENPAFRGTGTWHRKLLTPLDPRIGRRHEAPIGDTHRWDSGMGEYFGDLARFYREKEPLFAAEMMSTWRELQREGVSARRSPLQQLLAMDCNLPETPMEKMDWSSQSFFGFGAILRANFGTPRETFVSYKAGSIRGHYHNDENSFHYYALNTPVALDYNCSYHPRGDHAALHNSMTFGRLGTVINNEKNKPVEAQEQLFDSATVVHFVTKPVGDLVVSERRGKRLSMSPIRPEDAEFQREYPSRDAGEIAHRRLLLLVKHPTTSHMTDYLVVRDETRGSAEQQVNVHLLARDATVQGNLMEATGQQGVDMQVFLADATEPHVTVRSWWYADEWMYGPEEYWLREGETMPAWDQRMDTLMKATNAKTLPLPGFKPDFKNAQKGETETWLEHLRKTDGEALIPPKNWKSTWMYGEYQKWLRIETKPGTPVLWVLYPYRRDDARPMIERVDDKTVRVAHFGEKEEIVLDSISGARVKNASGEQVLLAAGELPGLGAVR